jgi:hypothetical protein
MWRRFIRVIPNKSTELLQRNGKHCFCIVSGTNFTAADNTVPVALSMFVLQPASAVAPPL